MKIHDKNKQHTSTDVDVRTSGATGIQKLDRDLRSYFNIQKHYQSLTLSLNNIDMINPLDYLFYKIYKAWSFGGGTPTRHLVFMDMLLLTNLLTIYILIVGEFPSDAFFYGVGALILMFTSISYFSSKKEKKNCAKFEKESEKSRIIGNFIIICYVILTFASVIWVFKTYGKA